MDLAKHKLLHPEDEDMTEEDWEKTKKGLWKMDQAVIDFLEMYHDMWIKTGCEARWPAQRYHDFLIMSLRHVQDGESNEILKKNLTNILK